MNRIIFRMVIMCKTERLLRSIKHQLGLLLLIVTVGFCVGCNHRVLESKESGFVVIPLVSGSEYSSPGNNFWEQTSPINKDKICGSIIEHSSYCVEHEYQLNGNRLVLNDVREDENSVFYIFEVNPDKTEDSVIVYVYGKKNARFICRFPLHMA